MRSSSEVMLAAGVPTRPTCAIEERRPRSQSLLGYSRPPQAQDFQIRKRCQNRQCSIRDFGTVQRHVLKLV